jgi:phosphomannomutase / phosphoglucomutase
MTKQKTPFDLMFREYDVRGRVNDGEMCEQNVRKIAKGFAVFLSELGQNQIVIGHDLRSYSPKFAKAAIDAMVECGFKVYDIGLALSPVTYFAQYHLKCPGAIMITASHNPDGWSGFKLAHGYSKTLGPDGISRLKELIDTDATPKNPGKGSVERPSVRDAYIERVVSSVNIDKNHAPKIVIDAANGGAGVFAYEIFQKIGCLTFQLYCDPNDTYPNYSPNPSDVKARKRLAEMIRHPYINADIGIAFDGDGDRIGVIDKNGNNVWSDKILLLLACQLLEKKKGAKIVFDVKCSRLLTDEIRKRGGVPVMWKTGHSYIKSKMHEVGADLAGERSGHIFVGGDYYGFDDALFTAVRLIEYLAKTGKTIDQLLDGFQHYETSPEIKTHCDDQVKYKAVEEVAATLKAKYGNRVNEINGARVEFDDGWGLIRASSNMPELVLIFEAQTKARMMEIRKIFKDITDKVPAISSHWENDIAAD